MFKNLLQRLFGWIKRRPWKRIFGWLLTLGVVGGLVGVLILTILLAWYSRELPDPDTLLDRKVAQSTKIFDRTGKTVLYEIHGGEKRTLVKIENIPDIMKWATIAVEDKTFYTHHGVNVKRVLKVIYVDLLTGRRAQGASTLTQQFVKNAILTNEKSLTRKLKEILLAVQIERHFTKDQILQMYFNEIPYGSTLYGVESAAQGYFGKSSKDVTLDEAALLAALPQAPDTYSPYGTGLHGDNRDKLVIRQHMILDLMAEQKYITAEQAEEAKKVDTLKKLLPKKIGNILAPHFVMYIRSQLIDKYGQRAVEEGGLKVRTSLDWDMQQMAQDEVEKGVNTRGEKYKFTNASLVALDPKTGQILSMVGSKDFFDEEHDGQVNVALRLRQPGSSFKPIVYTAGFLKGYTPEMTLWDVNTRFKTDLKNYEPKNYDLSEHGPVSLRRALQGSLNIPAVKMLYLVGVGNVLDFADKLGYTSFADRGRFGLALVLGGGEVKLLEHAHAYAAFASEGKQYPLASILKVEDSSGAVLEEWKASEGTQVFDRNAALQISNVLSDNVARSYIFGGKNYLTLSDRQVAAKTGTTNNFHDAWTMGYTPNLVAGVWVGNNDNSEMKRGADGSVIAAPIWQGFMSRATKTLPKESFVPPAPTNTDKAYLLGKATERVVKVDKVTGKLATDFTPPDLVEMRPVREAHSELWYLDKDNPHGPIPSDPTRDPQFSYWESAVQAWATRTSWNATSSAPTEVDDVHTPDNQPQITIVSPQTNSTLTQRDFMLQVNVTSQRRLTRFEVSLDNQLIGSALGDIFQFPVHIPANVTVGFHDLGVTAIDDVGNRGSANITINLLPDQVASGISITSPQNDAHVSSNEFPSHVDVSLDTIANVENVNIYLEENVTGDTRLLASVFHPSSLNLNVAWNTAPTAGTYNLYVVVTKSNGTTSISPRQRVVVEL